MGKIVLILNDRPTEPWKNHLLAADPDLQIDSWPDVNDFSTYDTAVVWNHQQGLLMKFPNLRMICSLGAGVDHILSDTELPAEVAITRIVDKQLTISMSNYIISAVLNHQRHNYTYQQQQLKEVWYELDPPELDITVGFLGLGVLGNDAAVKLASLGFEVHGFSRTRKGIEQINTHEGEVGLKNMLSQVNVLINLLPLTSDTVDILNLPLFEKCRPGTYLINVARGQHLVEADLITALDKGFISGAMLDVFRQEPLPKDHPFWKDERIKITPHIASVTDPASAASQIAENHRRLQGGQALLHTVDITKEY